MNEELLFETLDEQPASIYDLLIYGNYLDQLIQSSEINEQALHLAITVSNYICSCEKPLLVHSDSVHKQQSKQSLDALRMKLERLKNKIDLSVFSSLNLGIETFQQGLDKLHTTNDKAEFYIDKDFILKVFQTQDFCDIAFSLTANDLLESVSFEESDIERSLLTLKIDYELVKNIVFDIGAKLLDYKFKRSIEIEGKEKTPSLLWGMRDDKLLYQYHNETSPVTFLTFEIPHNVAHFIHLDQQQNSSSVSYTNSMKQRAFFESIAVYGERLLSGVIDIDPFTKYLQNITNLEDKLISSWYINARKQQNMLRSVRYFADLYTMSGYSHYQVKEQIQSMFANIPKELIQKEVNIYYQWTGLGSVYISGAAKLLELYRGRELDLFRDLKNNSNSWGEFNKEVDYADN